MFEPERRDLAWVPRWGIARVNRRQSVAEHSYFVTAYGLQIAYEIGWPDVFELGLHREMRAETKLEARYLLALYLLRHDEREALESDIPGPIKRLSGYSEEGINPLVSSRFGAEPVITTSMVSIRRAADFLDECLYLAGEINSGNSHVTEIFANSKNNLVEAIRTLSGNREVTLRLQAKLLRLIEMEVVGHKNCNGMYGNDQKGKKCGT